MPRGGRRPGAGRKKGGKNLATVERELLRLPDYRSGERKLAKDVLIEFMGMLREIAIAFHKSGDVERFAKYADMAGDFASALAPYQTPRLQAIALAAPPPEARSNTSFTINLWNQERQLIGRVIDGSAVDLTEEGNDESENTKH